MDAALSGEKMAMGSDKQKEPTAGGVVRKGLEDETCYMRSCT